MTTKWWTSIYFCVVFIDKKMWITCGKKVNT